MVIKSRSSFLNGDDTWGFTERTYTYDNQGLLTSLTIDNRKLSLFYYPSQATLINLTDRQASRLPTQTIHPYIEIELSSTDNPDVYNITYIDNIISNENILRL